MFNEKFSKKNQKSKKKLVQKFAEGGPVNGWPTDKERFDDQKTKDATSDRGRRRNRPAIGTGREKDEE